MALILSLATLLCSTHCQNISWMLTTPKVVIYYPSAGVTAQGVTDNPASVTTPIPEKTGCGWRQDSGLANRITESNDAMFGEFPWVVAIFKYSAWTGTYEYCCVGSLIHHRLVLTVKHYFKTPARIRIHAGDWDIASTKYEIHYHQSSDVKSIVGHPNYNSTTNAYDAALLVLSTSINLAANVAFACLPPPASSTPAGVRCFVAGWGYETYYNGTVRNIQKMVELPVVEHSVCQSQLSTKQKRHIDLPDSMMCAGGEAGQDACLKDGGAPLVCPYKDTKGRYYQAGIVSWGIGCGLPDVPGVYTSLPAIREWIDSTMAGMKYDITYAP